MCLLCSRRRNSAGKLGLSPPLGDNPIGTTHRRIYLPEPSRLTGCLCVDDMLNTSGSGSHMKLSFLCPVSVRDTNCPDFTPLFALLYFCFFVFSETEKWLFVMSQMRPIPLQFLNLETSNTKVQPPCFFFFVMASFQ